MAEIDIVSQSEAEDRNLVQITEDACHTEKEINYLCKEAKRILQDTTREAVIVKRGIYVALWVDDAAARLSKIQFGGINDI
jgi:hypothetical protein